MRQMSALRISSFLALCMLGPATARAELFGGIDFPHGAVSFADEVVSFEPLFSGGPAATHPDLQDPASALGPPNYVPETGAVALGNGGRIVLRFVDNMLTGSGDSRPDLHVFEVGGDVEATFVEISRDGVEWLDVGRIGGSISSIDIDAFGHGPDDRFRYVRLTDDPAQGNDPSVVYIGADIDAVGALSMVATPTCDERVEQLEDQLALCTKDLTALQGEIAEFGEKFAQCRADNAVLAGEVESLRSQLEYLWLHLPPGIREGLARQRGFSEHCPACGKVKASPQGGQ